MSSVSQRWKGTPMPFKKITVIGAGTMGRWIAETAAARGIETCVVEVNPAQRLGAEAQIRASVERGIKRGKIAASGADEVLARIRFEGEITAAGTAEFVIEAVSENEPLKVDLFRQLDKLCAVPVTTRNWNTIQLIVKALV